MRRLPFVPLLIPAFLIATAALAATADERSDTATGSDAATETVALFDGSSLDGWTGDERFWSVEDAAIVGRTTKDNPAEQNTFLVYERRSFEDFILTFEYRVRGFNSGVQYRSRVGEDHSVAGYQADFEARWHDDGTADKFTGMFFEEGGRMFLGQRGQAVVVGPAGEDGKPGITEVGSVGDAAELEKVIKRDDWNRYTVVASGNAFIHSVNGRVLSVAVDADAENAAESGVVAFQLHSGTPMEIRVRDITVRPLK